MSRGRRFRHAITLGSVTSLSLGFLLVAYSAGSEAEGVFFQWSGRRQIENGIVGHNPFVAAASPVPADAASPRRQPAQQTIKKPRRGEPLATLDIPSVGLSVVVLEGSDDRTLKRGPGHIEDTAYPGQLGNVVIAAHRDTHFRPLRKIKKNDAIDVKTPVGTVRYYVESMGIIEPTRLDILDPTPDATLTLFTCYPFEYIGHAPQRFLVRATLAKDAPKPDIASPGKGAKPEAAKEAGNAN